MDWCVDARVSDATRRAELEVAAHLAVHAVDPKLVQMARQVVHQLMGELPGPVVWLHLDWTASYPLLSARALPDVPPGVALPGVPLAPGLTAAESESARLIGDLGSAASTERRLGVTRIGADDTNGFEVTVSLQLPRGRLSVPVTRHLTHAALAQLGVLAEDICLVDLALAEACANVVEHSEPGALYYVAMTVSMDLAEIRVVDRGRGFDYRSLAGAMADPDAACGRGIALMRALVDEVQFESLPEEGTIVHLVKYLRFDDKVPGRRLMLEDHAPSES